MFERSECGSAGAPKRGACYMPSEERAPLQWRTAAGATTGVRVASALLAKGLCGVGCCERMPHSAELRTDPHSAGTGSGNGGERSAMSALAEVRMNKSHDALMDGTSSLRRPAARKVSTGLGTKCRPRSRPSLRPPPCLRCASGTLASASRPRLGPLRASHSRPLPSHRARGRARR